MLTNHSVSLTALHLPGRSHPLFVRRSADLVLPFSYL